MKPSIKRRYPLYILASIAIIMVLIIYADILINISPSMKLGLYMRVNSEIKRGDIVAICMQEPYRSEGLKRNYLLKSNKCSGIAPLIKEVVGVPGDELDLQDDLIMVNGKNYFYKTKYIDKTGSPLKVYPRGSYHNINGYWLLGTNAKNSWDSRYFGFVAPKDILYKILPLVVFG